MSESAGLMAVALGVGLTGGPRTVVTAYSGAVTTVGAQFIKRLREQSRESENLMRIVKHEITDCELYTLCVVFRKAVPGARERVEAIVEQLINDREVAGICHCRRKHLDVAVAGNQRRVEIAIQWVCDTCLSQLIQRLDSTLSEATQLELGVAWEDLQRDVGRLLLIPTKTVELEDASIEQVGAFLIGKYPVTVGEMTAFCEATGYTTSAEIDRSRRTFRTYPSLMRLPKRAWDTSVVYYVSHLDAEAYCRWAAGRLPTEREWLAAAIADPSVAWQYEDRVQEGGVEWTATVVPQEGAVVRSGPAPTLEAGWRSGRHRHIRAMDYYDSSTTFRICRSAP